MTGHKGAKGVAGDPVGESKVIFRSVPVVKLISFNKK